MNEQTKRFDDRLRNMSFHLEDGNIVEILQSCKEVGLKFLPDELYFKRTVIGSERSVPDGTEIHFLFDDEYSKISKIEVE